jgi:hypothetical protein
MRSLAPRAANLMTTTGRVRAVQAPRARPPQRRRSHRRVIAVALAASVARDLRRPRLTRGTSIGLSEGSRYGYEANSSPALQPSDSVASEPPGAGGFRPSRLLRSPVAGSMKIGS